MRQEKYFSAILNGDGDTACGIVREALADGLLLRDVYSEIFVPAQRKLAEMWVGGSITQPTETRATQITLDLLTHLRGFIKPTQVRSERIVVLPAERGCHNLSTLLFGDMMCIQGWKVGEMPEFASAELMINYLKTEAVALVCAVINVPRDREPLIPIIQALRAIRPNPPKVLVGGPSALLTKKFCSSIPADGFAGDVLEAVDEATRILESLSALPHLSHYLQSLGAQVHKLRIERGFSQQELARRAGLDRAYLSSVEHGKQNVTIGVVAKLASALSLRIDQMLQQVAFVDEPK